MRPYGAIALLIFAATLAVFVQVRDHEFVNYDDYVYLSKIETGLTVGGVRRAFTGQVVSNWIPLTWLTLLVDYELYDREPAGYHLTSVVLHALSAVLLFLVLVRMTRATWRSAFVAGAFALHPVHVESVAWLSERKDVLSGLMFVLLLHAYLAYTNRPNSVARHLAVLLALAAGLLA